MADVSTMNGKVALVTGATSGLGRASALALAEAGARLFLIGRDADGLAETVGLLPDREVATHVADLADPAACSAVIPAAIERFGQIDALCNIAGIIFVANSHEMPIGQWNNIIATNLTAPFLLSQAAIPYLLQTGGSIVNIASAAAFTGQAYGAAYSASKAGLVGMTKSMAMEYSRQSIRINAIAPGGMMTNVARNFRPPEGCDFDLMKRFTGPRGGMVEVPDVAALVVYLASDSGRGFHGACLNIDAGVTAG
ncbi:MAG: SDR family oxidoreductase [Sphingobium sp.]